VEATDRTAEIDGDQEEVAATAPADLMETLKKSLQAARG
ncbi:MAG: hypothetical protein JWP18_28, partial [Solirubrobacterales bacterium]|nr:hypothetical protein [Solirubrobacterales bacterium]